MDKIPSLLASHFFSCTSAQPQPHKIVLLHGWGCSSESWQPLLPELQAFSDVFAIDLPGFGDSIEIADYSLAALVDLIAPQIPESSILIGWSLGGMLAVHLASLYPQKVACLVTMAANLKFVADENYASAMPREINQQFNRAFAEDGPATLRLFSGLLSQGDASERSLLKKVRGFAAPDTINRNWLDALHLLAQLDNRDVFAQLSQPGLHLLAEKDALVTPLVVDVMKELNASQQLMLVPGAAHALHWSQPETVAQSILRFLNEACLALRSEAIAIEKRKIAQSFSRAATTYDAVAELQRKVGEKLLCYATADANLAQVLDLGCGTGHFMAGLRHRFPGASVIGADIAEGMLAFARNHQQGNHPWLCCDAEYLPLGDSSIDLIFSNLALQWCNNLPLLLQEMSRVLKPGGRVLVASLGSRTLHEIKSAWQAVDNYVHVNRFYEPESWCEEIEASGMCVKDLKREESIVSFSTFSEMARSLKALGAHNMNQGRAPGLGGRQKISAFKSAYENFRCDGLLPATYDIYYLIAEKK